MPVPGNEAEEDGDNERSEITDGLIVEGVDIAAVFDALGGKENIVLLDNCATRLRLDLKDDSVVNEAELKKAGAKGVIRLGKNSIQVVIGMQVQSVADAMREKM